MKTYKISDERQNAYLNNLEKATVILRKLPKNVRKNELVDEIASLIIDVLNSMRGFKRYYDKENIEDFYLYTPGFSELDNMKFYEIEFGMSVSGKLTESRKLNLCEICKQENADYCVAGELNVHEACLVKNKWYECCECGKLFPYKRRRCRRCNSGSFRDFKPSRREESFEGEAWDL